MKIGTKSIRSNVPQVDVGVIDDGASFDDPRAVQRYLSNRKNPGNTKYVFDGHWLMELDGNC